MCSRITAIALLVPFMALTAFAQGMGRQPDALKNMRSFSVNVVSLDRTVLTNEQLQTQVELRLRRAGLSVKDCTPKTGCVLPQVFVKLAVFQIKGKVDSMICLITIECNTAVASIGQPDRHFIATVWMNEDTIVALDDSTVRNRIDDLVDQFANDYLSVNPK